MKKTTVLGMLAVLFVGILFSTSAVNAYRGDYSVKSPDYSAERCEQMKEAFETVNYQQWNEQMKETGKNSKVMSVLNENNFEKFVQARKAAMNHDFETATNLRAELGLNNGNGHKDGNGFGKETGQGQNKQQNNKIQRKFSLQKNLN